RWAGNIKKFSVDSKGVVMDANGMEAIGSNGFISEKACSYWSDCSSANDGNDVKVGGAAARLQQNATRVLKSDLGTDGALVDFNKGNAEWVAGGPEELAAYMGVTKEQVPILLQWARGDNVDNDSNASSQNIRQDVMGDPLHSKPLPIKIGGKEYVFVGTNHGVMHMFDGQTGEEVWGFLPYQLLPNLRELRSNVPTGVHSVYGLDSPPVGYVHKDVTGEKVWIFFGMRRGGKSYYAMDVSDPQNPKLMWKIGPDSPGMSELAQTWAEPVVTKIPGWPSDNTDADTAKPVLIFGAGYSPATKDSAFVGVNDTEGRGVFIIDAASGDLVHSFGPANGSKMTQMPGITDSIPNAVAVLDSNSDGLTDRIYATDTGANVWRMDLPSVSPNNAEAPWTAFKFASLGGTEQIADRRFFAEPVVAQTMFSNITETTISSEVTGETSKRLTYQNIPYDAVVVGTGHRPHPTDKKREDMFFTLQDRNVVTKSFGTAKNPIPAPLTKNDLYPVTDAPPTSQSELVEFGTKRGWFYDFSGDGEKSLSAAAIVFGRVYFTTYVPGDTSAANVCLAPGQGRFYGFDLHRGTRTFTQEYLEMGEQVPDTPQLVIPPGGSDNMYFIGIGNAGEHMQPVEPAKGCDPGDPRCIGGGMRANRIYYYIEN
ncbi:MAG: rRNA (guanine-N1)-methyltransferase, partial [Shewanella sp.]|nr:rRNA (guanine-N1)-methyltransferase [Shewanella sp.]